MTSDIRAETEIFFSCGHSRIQKIVVTDYDQITYGATLESRTSQEKRNAGIQVCRDCSALNEQAVRRAEAKMDADREARKQARLHGRDVVVENLAAYERVAEMAKIEEGQND